MASPASRSRRAAPSGRGAGGRLAVGYVAVLAAPGAVLEPGHARYLGLVRRELALAFRAAQLRGELARERATLAAILDGASDAIVAVGIDRRITRLNRAASRLVGSVPRPGVGETCEEFLGCLLPGAPDPAEGEAAAPGPRRRRRTGACLRLRAVRSRRS